MLADSRAAPPSGRPAGLAGPAGLVGPAGRAARAGGRAAGLVPAGTCDRAIAAACGSCRRARRARTSCRRRRRPPSAARDGPSAGFPASVGDPAASGARHPWRRSAPSVRAVLTGLDALTLAPERFMESNVYLGLRSIFWQLSRAKSEDQLRDVVARMWDMAVHLEDGTVSDAEQALRA